MMTTTPPTLRSSTTLLLLLLASILSTTASPVEIQRRGTGYSGPRYTWENPPPPAGAEPNNQGNSVVKDFSFAKWVDDATKKKATSSAEALAEYKKNNPMTGKRSSSSGEDDDDDDDELPPWYFTNGPGRANFTGPLTKRDDAGPTCYWHKNDRPLVEDSFSVVTAMAYHPELYYIEGNGGRDITHKVNTCRFNVRSIDGKRYAVKGTDIARGGGTVMDFWLVLSFFFPFSFGLLLVSFLFFYLLSHLSLFPIPKYYDDSNETLLTMHNQYVEGKKWWRRVRVGKRDALCYPRAFGRRGGCFA